MKINLKKKKNKMKNAWSRFEKCLTSKGQPPTACKLVFDRGRRTFELHIPIPQEKNWVKKLEKQEQLFNSPPPRVAALDPGVRTFQTVYSPNGVVMEFGNQDAQRLCRLAHHFDKLSVKIDNETTKYNEIKAETTECKIRDVKRKRALLCKAHLRLTSRITHLVDEVHWQTINVLCREFDVMMIPKFNVQQMVIKSGDRRRRINRSVLYDGC